MYGMNIKVTILHLTIRTRVLDRIGGNCIPLYTSLMMPL